MIGPLNELATEITKINSAKGFRDKLATSTHPLAVALMNLQSEISELWEAYRRGKLHDPCDKGIDLTCAEEELADIIIRTLDTADFLGIDIDAAVQKKIEYNRTRPLRHGGKTA